MSNPKIFTGKICQERVYARGELVKVQYGLTDTRVFEGTSRGYEEVRDPVRPCFVADTLEEFTEILGRYQVELNEYELLKTPEISSDNILHQVKLKTPLSEGPSEELERLAILLSKELAKQK